MTPAPGRAGPAVVVFLKAPAPGTVKTRLMPRFSAAEAAGLYRAMVEDLLERLDRVEGAALRLCFAPPRARSALHAWLGRHVYLEPQRGRDLGARMVRALRTAFHDGHDRVVIVGSDVPGLSARRVAAALTALRHHDVVIGPSADGGYYLIGMSRVQPALFADMPWSTRRVLGETLRRANRLSLTVKQLPALADIDVPADVRRLRKDLASRRSNLAASPRLAALLRRMPASRKPPPMSG